MRRAWVTTVLVGSAVLLSAIAAGQGGAPATISVDEIRPGMRGHGLTVFRGTEPERFDVEVIDVLRAFRPGQDLILIRTPHPVLDRAGTVAGMSGSPIYLDGRLAGAYAYGWLFGRDPVAGVTPIANMLAELGRPVRRDAFPGAELLPRTARASGAGAAEAPRVHRAGLPPWDGSGRVRALDALRRHAERRGRPREGLVPVATPLWLAGFDERVAALLGEELSGFGLVALQGGGSGARSGRRGTARYVDGGAIGVQLIRGDVAATAVGTVTHVAGRRLIAFGHPMLDAGELGLPTCTARVLHVLVSEARSFKIAEAAEPLGALVHDRQATIVVDTSIDGVTIPVRLRVLGVAGAPRTEWNVEVASHRLLSPVLLLAATLNALAATASDDAHAVLVARQRVHVSGRPPLELVDHVAAEHGPTDLRALSGLRLFEVVEAAYGNPFEEARVERVEVDLEVSFRRDWKRIVDVSVAEPQVDPGARIDLRVVLREYGRPDRVHVVPVEVPLAAAGRTLEIRVESGDAVALEQPLPRSLDDLLGAVRRRLPSTSLVVSMALPSRGLRLQGHVVPDLPGSALDALSLTADTSGGVPFTTHLRRSFDLGDVVVGAARLSLEVRPTPRNR